MCRAHSGTVRLKTSIKSRLGKGLWHIKSLLDLLDNMVSVGLIELNGAFESPLPSLGLLIAAVWTLRDFFLTSWHARLTIPRLMVC